MRFWVYDSERHEALGPYTVEQLRKRDDFSPETLVAPESAQEENDWRPAKQFEEMRPIFLKPPPLPGRKPPLPPRPKPAPPAGTQRSGRAPERRSLADSSGITAGGGGGIPVVPEPRRRRRVVPAFIGRRAMTLLGLAALAASVALVNRNRLLGPAPAPAPVAPVAEPEPEPSSPVPKPPPGHAVPEASQRGGRKPKAPAEAKPAQEAPRHHSATGRAGLDEFVRLAHAIGKTRRVFPMGPVYFVAPEEVGAERAAGEVLTILLKDGEAGENGWTLRPHVWAPSIVDWKEAGQGRRFFIQWPPGKAGYDTVFTEPLLVYVECDVPLPLRKTQVLQATYGGCCKEVRNARGETAKVHFIKAFAAAGTNRTEEFGGVVWPVLGSDAVYTFDDAAVAELAKAEKAGPASDIPDDPEAYTLPGMSDKNPGGTR